MPRRTIIGSGLRLHLDYVEDMMTNIQTNEALLRALAEASPRSPSFDQLDKQRLSFVMGVLPEENEMTREEVQDVLEQQEGRKLAIG